MEKCHTAYQTMLNNNLSLEQAATNQQISVALLRQFIDNTSPTPVDALVNPDNRKLAICTSCEHNIQSTCNVTAMPVHYLTTVTDATCPKSKW